jgi:hypothetical protein
MMKIKRKPLLLEGWHNSKEPRPDGHPAEPMPKWLKESSERSAAPGTTFLTLSSNQEIIVHAGHIVYRDALGGVHSISPERFAQEYDIVDLQKKDKEDEKPEETE